MHITLECSGQTNSYLRELEQFPDLGVLKLLLDIDQERSLLLLSCLLLEMIKSCHMARYTLQALLKARVVLQAEPVNTIGWCQALTVYR